MFTDVGLATTPAEIARRRRDQTAGALPILGWAIGPAPIIRLDCNERPDVADLPRVFELEPGAGAVRTSWKFMLDARGADSLFSAHVVFEAPVVCRFTI